MKRTYRMSLSPMLKRIKFYFDMLKKTTDGYLFVADLQSGAVMLSPNLVADFNLPGELITDMDKYWAPLIHPEERQGYLDNMRALIVERSVDEHDMEYRVKERKGDYCWIRCRGRISFDYEGKPAVFAGMMMRMGQRNQADSVTGLLNKYQFEHAVKMALANYRATGEGGALMVIGLDNFKIINETYNRFFGDQVLKQVAQQIEKILSSQFTLYKLDGDEFGLIYPNAAEEDVEKLFSSIQTCLMRPQKLEDKMYFCTISAGTVFYPQAGKDYLVLHKHAEAAMDMAKRDGKNKNCMFTKDQYNRWVRSISMRDNIKLSVEQGCEGFSLFYQPQVSANGQQLIGAEALLRWKNPKGRMVAPMEFIPILEETKMIIPVGKWIVNEAVKTCRKWQALLPDFRISINVSYEQIKDPTFKDFVRECVDRHGVRPETVVLEPTESSIVSDWNFINQQFEFFHERGLQIAMDDFGTGYSSLASLKNLSCDIIKIDREFVKKILSNNFDRSLVKYTVILCHSAGMRVCIEGVEEQEEYDLLTTDCKVDAIQGYLFGHPESEENFEEKFLKQAAADLQKD